MLVIPQALIKFLDDCSNDGLTTTNKTRFKDRLGKKNYNRNFAFLFIYNFLSVVNNLSFT